MEYRKYSKYYQLSLKDKVKPIPCWADPDHPGMVPNLKIDSHDKELIYFYCLACQYKFFPGLDFYHNIESILEEIEDDEED